MTKSEVSKSQYQAALEGLHNEMVKLQHWVRHKGLRVVVLFEGRDAAGKGGVIKRMAAPLNPRGYRLVALSKPTEQERGEWYFQRYVKHLPTEGEIVFFDRSWYNRAGVEKVMGFCTDGEYEAFLRTCPAFEEMLISSGIILIKYWFAVSEEEQEKRFQARNADDKKRWKLSPIDLAARAKFRDYSVARDKMFAATHTHRSPWYVVHSDDKYRARLNCLQHFLSLIPYEDLIPEPFDLPPRQLSGADEEFPIDPACFIPEPY
ncbi:MAG: polyphosphate kinase 2 [Alphaproteobacteria bacterium]|nr:MAG: polyphosphate kinase 2 [Alphaproteobacteria bacterium]